MTVKGASSDCSLAWFADAVYPLLRPGCGPQQLAHLGAAVRLLERWAGRRLQVAELSEDLLRGLLAAYATNRAAATVNMRRAQLLAVWRAAAESGYHPRSPGRIAKWPEPRRIPRAWSTAEVAQLVCYCRGLPGKVDGVPAGLWWASLVLTGYWTACRASALRQARSEDFCPADGWLLIRAEVQKPNADQLFHLPSQAIAEIAAHHDPGRELIWPWPYHRRTFWVHLRRHVEAAGLSADRRGKNLFQRLRRTAISYAAQVSLEAARELAGHSTVELTRRYYVDPRIAPGPSALNVLPTLDV